MQKLLLPLLLCTCVFIACQKEVALPEKQPVQPSEDQLKLIEVIDLQASPIIDKAPLDLADKDLWFLDQFGDRNMLALGEATHGTKEFFQMKDRIFRYMVENHGHKVYVFEADFAEGILINRYITDGVGDLDDLMRRVMHFWTWRTEEVKELLLWMRNYNEGKADADKIHFMGHDCQQTTFQSALVLEYLKSINPAFFDSTYTVMRAAEGLQDAYFSTLSEEDYLQQMADLQDIVDFFDRHKEELVPHGSESEREFELHRHLVVNLRQSIETLYGYATRSQINHRDRYMAENTRWISSFYDEAKVTIWAHNLHIANHSTFGIGGSMGHHLKNQLRDEYQILGFSFAKGGFQAIRSGRGLIDHYLTDDPPVTSINFLLYHSDLDTYILDMKSLRQDAEWAAWLQSNRLFLNIGAVYEGSTNDYYRATPLTTHYDFLIHYNETTPAEGI